MDKLDFLKQEVNQKQDNITLRGMLKSMMGQINQYAFDEESGKLSSSLLGDLAMTAIPGVGLAGTIGRKPLTKLLPSLTKRIGGTQKDWRNTFSRDVLDEFDKNQGFFYSTIRLIDRGLPETDVRYPFAKKTADFYYNKIKK
tara:strand:+ start:546 stop:971 length:426 start_codon:yes stop_codon:yes gene_type:complete